MKFKGVTWHVGRFRASIKVNGRTIHLGRYDTAEQAHEAYVAAAQKHFGKYANAG
jgi:hypothetical protein